MLSSTMSQPHAMPLQEHPPPAAAKSLFPAIILPLSLQKCSFCPLVSYSQRCVRISRYHRHPALPTPFIQHPLQLHPTPTCAYAEEGSISTVATAKHHTTKEMRTSDSNHQEGRWQNKGGRRWSERQECAKGGKKGRERAFFSLFPFFSYLFLFSQESSSPTWHMSNWGGGNLPRGWGPLFCLHATLHGALSFSRQFTFQNRRWADQRRSLTMRPFISGWHGMLRYYTVRFHWS